MTALTDHVGGLAWSEDPQGRNLRALRVDFEGAQPHSLTVPRRGGIGVTPGADPQVLSVIRERVLAAEVELGGPAVLRWRSGDGEIATEDARLIDEPLPWGGGPGRGLPQEPHEQDRWSRANAGEVIPNVMTPLSWSVINEGLDAGFHSPWGDWPAGRRFVALYDGYAYFNIGLLMEMIQQRLGLTGVHFLEAVGGPEAAAAARSGLSTRAATKIRWRTMVRQVPFMMRWLRDQGGLAKEWIRKRGEAEAERDRLKGLDLSAMSDREIMRELTRSGGEGERQTIFLMHAQGAVYSSVQGLLWATDRWLGADQRNLTLSILQGLPGVRTQEGNLALRGIAERAARSEEATQFVRSYSPQTLWEALHGDDLPAGLDWLRSELDDFIAEYGHRAAGELELAEPRWVERPELILETFREYVLNPKGNSPDEMMARQRRTRLDAERQIRERLYESLVGRIRWLLFSAQLQQARRLQHLRENPKFTLLELSLQQRRLLHELADRWIARGLLDEQLDIYYLLFDELSTTARGIDHPVVAARMRSRIQRRRRQFDEWRQSAALPLRDQYGEPVETGSDLEADIKASIEIHVTSEPHEEAAAAEAQAAESAGGGDALPLTLRGIAASTGAAEGRAHVADSPAIGRELSAGQILVARFTDPGWTPIFPLAAAVVTEIGGVLSHGAIVAREFGIPAVVNVQRATQQIRSGDLLKVDGSSGRVTILERG